MIRRRSVIRFCQTWWPLCISILALVVFYVVFTWSAPLYVLDGDDSVYVAMAEYFSPFSSDRNPAIVQLVMRNAAFPPLYPFMLGLVGADPWHLEFAHLLTVSFLISALLVYAWWIKTETKSVFQATALMVLFAVCPATLLQSLRILSENLYLLLSLTTALAIAFAARSRFWWYVAAVCAGLCTVTRSVGVTVVLAFIIYVFIHKNPRRWWLALISVAPMATWMVFKKVAGFHRSYIHVFDGGILNTILSPQRLAELIQNQSKAIWFGWLTTFDFHPSTVTFVVASILGVLCIGGWLYRLRHRRFDAIYITLYIGVIIVWPFPSEMTRFLFVIVPMLLFYGFQFAGLMASRLDSALLSKAIAIGYIAVIAFVLLPPVGFIATRALAASPDGNRFSPAWYVRSDINLASRRVRDDQYLIDAWSRVRKFVPENECVYHIKPVPFMLFANRMSYAPPNARDVESFLAQANQCRFYYVTSYTSFPYDDAFYPMAYLLGAHILDVEYAIDIPQRPTLGILVEYDKSWKR